MKIKKDFHMTFKILQYSKRYIPLLMLGVFLTCLDIAADMLVAKAQQIFIDTINIGEQSYLIILIKIAVLGIVTIPIVNFFGDFIRGYYPTLIGRDLGLTTFDHINRLPFSTRQKMHSGDLVTRCTRDVENSSTNIVNSFSQIFYNIILCAAAFIYLANMDLVLSLLVISIGPITFATGRFFDRKIRQLSLAESTKAAEVRGFLQEAFQGVSEVRNYNLHQIFQEKYSDLRNSQNELLKKKARYEILMRQMAFTINSILTVLLMYLTGLAVMNGRLSVGAIIAFAYLLTRVQEPFVGLSAIFGQLQVGLGAADRIFEVLDQKTEKIKVEHAACKALEAGQSHAIEFKNVSFAYEVDGQNVLFKNLNFNISPGESVALVGPSGSGKTTIARMCCGLFEPLEGEIKIFDQTVSEDVNLIRSMIAYVPQETQIFRGSVIDNIALGLQDVSEEEIKGAAGQAYCDTFINQMENKYESDLKERGKNLSGGQRKRISIARAFVRNAPLLIMDEPTSSLDHENSQYIREAIENLMKKKSTLATLITTHDLSLVKNMTRIIVLDQGKIVEEGTHEELLKLEGLYSKLYNYQFS